LTFHYNNKAEFDAIIREYGDRLACVIMEPMRNTLPEDNFLEYVRDGIHKIGGLFILDEITIGWRYCFGGSHLALGINPDMAIFAKAMGNGHPIAAVIGTREAMHGAEDTFISSTYWTESVGPTAALAAIKKQKRVRIWEHVEQIGKTVHNDWETLGKKHNLPIKISGFPCLAHFSFTEHTRELKTLYTVLMLKRGFLGNVQIDPTLAHTPEILALYRSAIDEVFAEISTVLKKGSYDEILKAIDGPVCHAGFGRLIP